MTTTGSNNAPYYNVDHVELASLSQPNNPTNHKSNDTRSESLLSSTESVNDTNMNSQELHHNNDKWGSIAFFIHIVIVVILVLVCVFRMIHQHSLNMHNENYSYFFIDDIMLHTLPWYSIGVLVSIFLTIMAMRCFMDTQKCSSFIKGLMIFNFIFFGCYAIYCCFYTEFILAYIAILLWLVSALSLSTWTRIQFITTMIEISVTMIQSNISVISIYAYSYLLLQYSWLFLWMTLLYTYTQWIQVDYIDPMKYFGMFLFFAFSWTWTSHVLRTIVRATTASCIGKLCVSSQQQINDDSTMWQLMHKSHQQSIGTSFGTICTNPLALENNCGCRTDSLKKKSVYTSIFIGLDRSNVKDTISNVRNFFGTYEVPLNISDYVVAQCIPVVGFSIGILSALYVVLMMYLFEWNPIDGHSVMVVIAIVPLYFGYTISMTLFGIVVTTMDTMVVCYYRYPNEFERSHPQLFTRLTDALAPSPNNSNNNSSVPPNLDKIVAA